MGRPQVPCFVFKADDDKYFFDVLRQTWVGEGQIAQTLDLTWMQNIISTEAFYMGWLLVYQRRKKLSIIQLSTGRRVPLPYLSKLRNYICRFSSSPPDCYVVVVHKTEGYFRTCRPGIDAAWGPKHKLFPDHIAEVNEDDQPVYDAVLCGQNIYAATKSCVVAIDTASLTLTTPEVTCFPLGSSYFSLHIDILVESEGQLYQVWRSQIFPDSYGVCKWGFSSHAWEDITAIGNRLFMIGDEYSASFAGVPNMTPTSGTVYFLSESLNICSFDLERRSLTTHHHCMNFQYNQCFNWLAMEEDAILEEDDVGTVKPDYQVIEHPKYLMARPPSRTRREADVVSWSPVTPWLMFANGYDDGIFRFIDPCSSIIYEQYIPELVNKRLELATQDGWILVLPVDDELSFLFNPFTRARIDFSQKCTDGMCLGCNFAFPSSPTARGCLLFFINPISEDGGSIGLLRLRSTDHGDDENSIVAVRIYNNYPPNGGAMSNPVYYKGLFCCVRADGNLGTYDAATDSWVIKEGHISLDPSTPVEKCFLIKLDDEDDNVGLISVFSDENYNPIGVYRWNEESERWREVDGLGDKTLFVGSKSCFMATAQTPEMGNEICWSMLAGECGNEILRRQLDTCIDGSFTVRDRHMQLWVQPKGVRFAYDRATGKRTLFRTLPTG